MRHFIIIVLISFVCVFSYAYDTYIFRVKVDKNMKKSDVENTFKVKGKRESEQPFYATHTLAQNDTNYVLVKITPSDEDEYSEMKENFGLPGIDLYRIYSINDSGVHMVLDNSTLFPVNKDWAVKRSSS